MFAALNYTKKLFDFLKGLTLSLLWVSAGTAALVIFCLHFRQLNDVFGALLSQTHVSQLEIMGATINFDMNSIALQLQTEDVADPAKVADVHATVKKLSSEDFDRLMYVDALQHQKGLCAYSKPVDRVQIDIETDQRLKANGLIDILEDKKTFNRLKDQESENGRATWCYTVKVTDKGYNVKTALVKTLGQAFDNKQLAME
ncbi:MAG: hypothetical protein J2P49_01545 [Methylocapsa sp.]|nr:hypothetical protein [Methylocapsa sp.]